MQEEKNSSLHPVGAEKRESAENAENKEQAVSGTSQTDFLREEKDEGDKYELSLEKMLKAGVHFGHKKSRWNPKMEPYIFGNRNGVHILDLEKTMICFEKALEKLEEVVAKKGLVLIVGTKKQAKDLVEAVARKVGIPFVNQRWLGGTFTNYGIIKKRLRYFEENKESLEKGRMSGLTKLERHKLNKKLEKIEEKMGGLVGMNRLPDIMIALDINKEKAAIDEAKRSGIPIIGLVDSNSDPDLVEYPIPANDDALSSLRYILGVFMKRIMEAKDKGALLAVESGEKEKAKQATN